MQVFEAHEELSDYNTYILFRNEARLHQIRTTPSRTELHYDPQIRAFQKGSMILSDIRRMKLGEDGDFLNDIFHLVFCVLDINNFNSYCLACTLIDSE